MSLEDIRTRIEPLRQLEHPSTIIRQRIETFERYELLHTKLEEHERFLAEEVLRWERDRAKCNTAAKVRDLRMHPKDKIPKQITKDWETLSSLAIRLGEIPEQFTDRIRPVLSPIVFPEGPEFVFPAFHTWLSLPPVTADIKYARGKGPGENEINALMGAIPPKGGRCDHALRGRKTAETKATDDYTFRGGATSRRNVNMVRRRVERIIDTMPELIRKAGKRLTDDEFRKLEWVVRLLNAVNESLEYGNMHRQDEQDFYSAIEILNHLDWNGTGKVHQEDEIIRDPRGMLKFDGYLRELMRGDESFFTDYIFLVRPVEKPTQYLVIPQVDFAATVHFFDLSKGDAHFRYYPPSALEDLTDVAAE